jgi:hypothetical protein
MSVPVDANGTVTASVGIARVPPSDESARDVRSLAYPRTSGCERRPTDVDR